MRRSIAPLVVLVLAVTQTAASAQTSVQKMTVQSLMKEGYTVAGTATSLKGGASVFLQKGNMLVYCYATETPTSPTVATQYCKPVK